MLWGLPGKYHPSTIVPLAVDVAALTVCLIWASLSENSLHCQNSSLFLVYMCRILLKRTGTILLLLLKKKKKTRGKYKKMLTKYTSRYGEHKCSFIY